MPAADALVVSGGSVPVAVNAALVATVNPNSCSRPVVLPLELLPYTMMFSVEAVMVTFIVLLS